MLKDENKIRAMAEGGRLLREILDQLLQVIEPGRTGEEIDQLARQLIKDAGGQPSFAMVLNYRWATCICTNDIIVHGIPSTQPFKVGDLVGIDVGMFYQGYHTDTAWSRIIDDSSSHDPHQRAKFKFLETGKEALKRAISESKVGKRVGHISQIIQQTIEGAGYSVVRSLVGHGVGKRLHEPPEIPGFLSMAVADTPAISEGMTLAIEVIFTQGKSDVKYDDDGWTIRTQDGSLAGLFEKTILVSAKGPVILT